MNQLKTLLMVALAALFFVSCSGDDDDEQVLSSDKMISSFVLRAADNPGLDGDKRAAIEANTIYFNLPPGTSVTSLIPTITLPAGTTISPASGTPVDFSNTVTYTVTAPDGSVLQYTVSVTVEDALSSEKRITSFAFLRSDNPSLPEDIHAVIEDGYISYKTIPAGVELNALIPTIEFDGQSVSPESGVAIDFSSNVVYTVYAEDGSYYNYTVDISHYTGPTVYVIGALTRFNTFHGALWRNGVDYTFTDHMYNTYPNALFVKGNVVHAVGYMAIGNHVATSWEIKPNGLLNAPTLNETSSDANAHSVFVSDNDDIYIAGSENKAGLARAKLWKNGTVRQLTEGFGVATGVSVAGGKVLVVGYEGGEGPVIRAKLWRENSTTNLTPDIERAHAKALFTSGGDVYVAIQIYVNQGLATLSVWRNGSLAEVTKEGFADVNSIYVYNGVVYLAGHSVDDNRYKATLWVNGVPTILSHAANSYAKSVFVHEGDVYVAGTVPVDGVNSAVLWKNGVPTTLAHNAYAAGVFVK